MASKIPAYQKYCHYDHSVPLVVLEAQIELRRSDDQIVIYHKEEVLQKFGWEQRDVALCFAVEQACQILNRDPNCLSSIALLNQHEAIDRSKKILENLITAVGTLAFEQALQEVQGKVEGVPPHRCYR